MTEQQTAEAFVRQQRPALMELTFGCEVIVAGIEKDNPGCEHDVVVDDRKDEHGRIGMGYFGHVHPDDFQEIIGHRPQLQDWLAVLEKLDTNYHLSFEGQIMEYNPEDGTLHLTGIWFDMDTGQPATEADYKAFNKIVSV